MASSKAWDAWNKHLRGMSNQEVSRLNQAGKLEEMREKFLKEYDAKNK